ncbi:MAG: hypothetical protein GY866_34980 [Proteobacteria bacterium]|nr:hypothetical protein [Pseudomonadota bacterium]
MDKDVSKCSLALVTTGGVRLEDQQPFVMQDPDGDASFREIPADAAAERLRITHNYYDHRDVDSDVNIVFPTERAPELKEAGDIGDVAHRHLSFMGHILNGQLDVLIKETAPQAAETLKGDGVDIVVLTPG